MRYLTSLCISLYIYGVYSDGTGLIGWGKTLYNPTCSFACRNVIRKQQLRCTPLSTGENHGTAHNPVSTPPSCFVKDPSFLKTMALCIDTYCPLSGGPSTSLIEDYWASHLGTGTLGNYNYVPIMSYQNSLAAAREDESRAASNTSSIASNGTSHEHMVGAKLKTRQHHDGMKDQMTTFKVSSPLPMAAGGSAPLNITSFVKPKDWQMQYNYMSDFEINEAGHSTMSIVIAIIAIFLPIPLSLLRFIPGVANSRGWTYVQSMIVYPALWGKHHREPLAGGIIPTRGQALYLFLIGFLNIILLLTPYTINQPQASFTSTGMQTLSIVGNRAGVMAMGNVVALFLFSTRNNVLLYITDWSYSTYLVLHRWLGYWAVFHTILHSVLLLAYYVAKDSYTAELARQYWIWGIVGTVAACAILPSSLLVVRQKFYEFFLVSHIVLSLLFIIGYYYHIWFVYGYSWGYEIWIFAAGGIWGVDRVVRLGRMAFHGSRTALVTAIQDVGGEYLRIDVEGKCISGGVAYLCFPTLGWRFWETHPFSVALSSVDANNEELSPTASDNTTSNPEKSTGSPIIAAVVTPTRDKSTTTFFTRTRSGVTKQLAARVSGSGAAGLSTRLRVLVDGPYGHSGRVSSQLAQCSETLCIAGGVGITACLPYLAQSRTETTKLFWSTRKAGLATALAPIFSALPSTVKVETIVGQRMDLDGVLRKEILRPQSDGCLGIVVCGPPGMADDVRQKVAWLARTNSLCCAYVLVDESFSW